MMNNKKVFILPRQVGKTQRVYERFIEYPHETIVLFHSLREYKRNVKKYNLFKEYKNRLFLANQSVNAFAPVNFSRVIFDEYFHYNKRGEIYNYFKSRSNNIYIYSTSDKLYNSGVVELLQKFKGRYPYSKLIEICRCFIDITDEEFNDHYYNFATDQNADVYTIDDIYPIGKREERNKHVPEYWRDKIHTEIEYHGEWTD